MPAKKDQINEEYIEAIILSAKQWLFFCHFRFGLDVFFVYLTFFSLLGQEV